MYKVCNLTNKGSIALSSLIEALFNNIPSETFEVVGEISEADTLLLYATVVGQLGQTDTEIHHPSAPAGHPLHFENIAETRTFIDGLLNQRKILLFDPLYYSPITAYPEYLTDTDIVINFSSLAPQGDNVFEWVGVEKRKFFQMHGVTRTPKTAVISADHAIRETELFNTMVEVLDKVYVTKDANFEHPSEKVKPLYLNHPGEIRELLNRVEFVVHLLDQKGPEILGIEGGLCGARPIYPGNNVYRDTYTNVKGVGLFDMSNPHDSLKDVLPSPSMEWYQTDYAEFVKKFAAENNVPALWKKIKASFDKQK